MNQRVALSENRHSAIVSVFAAFGVLWLLAGLPMNVNLLVLASLFGVLLIGLPHGGFDHRVGERLIKQCGWEPALFIFVAVYLLIAAAVVLGWFLVPLFTILIFFALSAWHFGLEEDVNDEPVQRRWITKLIAFSRGGMVIWVPCWLQSDAVIGLLQTTVPLQNVDDVQMAVLLWGVTWPIWMSLLVWDILRSGKTSASKASRFLGIDWVVSVRLMAFFLLFSIANPLLSFTIYFCCWHSVRGLTQLYRDYQGSIGTFFAELLPISVAAVILFLIGWGFWAVRIGWHDGAIRIVFVGLSAVAIPHLLLHVMVKILAERSLKERRGRSALMEGTGV